MVWTELAFGVSCIRSFGHGWHSCLHPGPTAFSKQVGVLWSAVPRGTCYILVASTFATFFADGYRTLHTSSPNLPLLASSSRSFGPSLNQFLHLPVSSVQVWKLASRSHKLQHHAQRIRFRSFILHSSPETDDDFFSPLDIQFTIRLSSSKLLPSHLQDTVRN